MHLLTFFSTRKQPPQSACQLILSVMVLVLLIEPISVEGQGKQSTESGHFVLASFSIRENAQTLIATLQREMPDISGEIHVLTVTVSGAPAGGLLHRVVLPITGPDQRQTMTNRLQQLGFNDTWWLATSGAAGKVLVESAANNVPANDPEAPVEKLTKKSPDSWDESSKPTELLTSTPEPKSRKRKPVHKDWVPPGFEDLNAPQKNAVDVFYGGYFLTSVKATFTTTEITLEEVSKLIQRISDLNDPDAVSLILEAPLYTNPAQVCRKKKADSCGQLSPSSVGVIFDQSQLKLDLFISPTLLKTRTVQQLAFLPPSDAGFSVLEDISIFTSGSRGGESTYNAASTTIFSYAENRLLLRSNFTSSDDFSIETMVLQREFQGRDYQAGIFRGNAGNFVFMKDTLFAGLTLESSLITREDLNISLGSDVEVFLDSRSRVEIYKDGKLLSTQYYDIGNQLISTASLPGGSYDIELRIINNAGVTRTETRFFSKTSRLPPKDQALFFVQLGEEMTEESNRVLPKGNNKRFFRAGISQRLTDSFGGRLGLSINEDSTLIEANLFKQGTKYELEAILARDDLNVSAVDLRLRYRFDKGSLNVTSRKIWNDRDPAISNSQIGPKALQASVSGSWRTSFGVGNLFFRVTEGANDERKKSYGVRWNNNQLFSVRNLSNSLELSRNDGANLLLLSASYRLNNGSWSNTVSSRYKKQDSSSSSAKDRFSGNTSSNWKTPSGSRNQYNVAIRADSQDTGSLETRLQAKSNLGEASLVVDYANENSKLNYSSSMKTSFAATSKKVGIGGARRERSGFLVSAKGNSEDDASISVLIDGSNRATIDINSTRFVPVSEYDIHEISFLPNGNKLLNVDTKIYRKSMYPGNVVYLEVEVKEIVVALGRVIDGQGNPIPNALLKNIEGLATTDELGYFQAEMVAGNREIGVKKGSDRKSVV